MIEVDVIVPVHNAAATLRETIASAMSQVWLLPQSSTSSSSPNVDSNQPKCRPPPDISIHVCCYNDASTDDSWSILQELKEYYKSRESRESTAVAKNNKPERTPRSEDASETTRTVTFPISSRLCISSSSPGTSARGAGYARNCAVAMRSRTDGRWRTSATTGAATDPVPPANEANDAVAAKGTTTSTTSTETTPLPQQRQQQQQHRFLCWLDSDDIMHPTRVYHQVQAFLALPDETTRRRTLMGCVFDRIPYNSSNNSSRSSNSNNSNDSMTPHYTAWANSLSAERLTLERFREITIIQPTWMMYRERFEDDLGGYLEAPPPPPSSSSIEAFSVADWVLQQQRQGSLSDSNVVVPNQRWRLVHATYDNATTLRVAEDLRLFHEHLALTGGRLQRVSLVRSDKNAVEATVQDKGLKEQQQQPLVSYRHSLSSQSSQTSRQLLLHLRVAAMERTILSNGSTLEQPTKAMESLGNGSTGGDDDPVMESPLSSHRPTVQCYHQFVIWGAGRDGKDFVKALSPSVRRRVYCMVDVDDQKIERGFYVWNNRTTTSTSSNTNTKTNPAKHKASDDGCKIPIVHFSLLAREAGVRHQVYHSWKYGTNASVARDESAGGDDNGARNSSRLSFGRIDKRFDPKRNDFVAHKTIQQEENDSNQPDEATPEPSRRLPKRAKVEVFANTESNQSLVEKKDPGVKAIDVNILPSLPVVVCVAMYRTNGALERNIKLIGRTEGEDLWHFS